MEHRSKQLNRWVNPNSGPHSRSTSIERRQKTDPVQCYPHSALAQPRPAEFEEVVVTSKKSVPLERISYCVTVATMFTAAVAILWTQTPEETSPGPISLQHRQQQLESADNATVAKSASNPAIMDTLSVTKTNQQQQVTSTDEPLFLQNLTPRALNADSIQKPLLPPSAADPLLPEQVGLDRSSLQQFFLPNDTRTVSREFRAVSSTASPAIDILQLPPVDGRHLGFNFNHAPWHYVLNSFAAQLKVSMHAPEWPSDSLTYADPTPRTLRDAFLILRSELANRGFELRYDETTLSLTRTVTP